MEQDDESNMDKNEQVGGGSSDRDEDSEDTIDVDKNDYSLVNNKVDSIDRHNSVHRLSAPEYSKSSENNDFNVYEMHQAHSVSNCDDGSSEDSIPSSGIVLPSEDWFEEVETGFRGRLKTYRLVDVEAAARLVTIPEFLTQVFDQIVALLTRVLIHVHAGKVNLWLECEFVNVHGETCQRAFKTKNIAIFRTSDLEEVCGEFFQKLVGEKEECEMKGSGWAFLRVLNMEVRVNVYRPLRGASYVCLPPDLIGKRAVVNVVNNASTDNKCFYYAVLSKFVNNSHREQLRPSHFTADVALRSNLDFTGMTYPVAIADIRKFERKNRVSVNVYGIESVTRFGVNHNMVYPLRVVKEEMDRHFDLLYLTNSQTTHYALITDFERLVRSQLTSHTSRIWICKRCFAHFDERPVRGGLAGQARLEEHRKYCNEHGVVRTDPPTKDKILFERPERSQRVRFTIYADFECALVPIEEVESATKVETPEWDPATNRPGLPHHRRGERVTFQSRNVSTHKVHRPYAYAYYIHDSEMTTNDLGSPYTRYKMYRGTDAAAHFMKSLRKEARCIGDILYSSRQNKLCLNDQEEASFAAAGNCYICGGVFGSSKSLRKVRDHQHSAPYRYCGAAHSKCNLRYRGQNIVNVYFHNLSNYDAHFVVRELGIDSGDVSVIANNEEKYISFTKRFTYAGAGRHESIGMRFVDSYRFLSKALASLVSILPTDQLRVTKRFFPEAEKFELVRRKGVFPYEHVTSSRVLDECQELPPAATFYNSLTKEDVSEEDYAHAQRVWEGFECQTLGDYAEVYLKCDIALLTDVFESFRDMCLEHYGLDPAHYVSLPSYAWDVMLRVTKVQLDTLRDLDMYLFFEKGIRGGLVQCTTRHVVADNKYTRGEGSDAPGRDTDTYLMYYDANNLYGWAMSQPLPYRNFCWLEPNEIERLDVMSIVDDSDVGYVLEVDVEYPRNRELQDRHRDLPFLPEMRKAPVDQLPYEADVLRTYAVGKNSKLMATQTDKTNYVVHYRLLRQAMENGLRVTRIHRVLRFDQKTWLQPYVHLNTELRRRAQNKFEVELFKLMVNAVYGMSLQNVRKHVDIRLATNPDSYTKYVARSNFVDRTWYNENLALVHMAKTHVVLDKPVYVGMTVLDHSKWWMYNFHYGMVTRYGIERIRLAYHDTDSLMYAIRTRDVYLDMVTYIDDFDTSNYPHDHPLYNTKNARVLGKFKDEAEGRILQEFIGLMAKLYCLRFHMDGIGPAPIKKAKGVNRAVVSHQLTIDDYRRCLFELRVKNTENERFQSLKHTMFTVALEKRSLAPFDDKRYVIPEDGGFNTLPWGHYLVPSARDDGGNDVDI